MPLLASKMTLIAISATLIASSVPLPAIMATLPAISIILLAIIVTLPAISVIGRSISVVLLAITVPLLAISVPLPAITAIGRSISVILLAITVILLAITVIGRSISVTLPAITVTLPAITVTLPAIIAIGRSISVILLAILVILRAITAISRSISAVLLAIGVPMTPGRPAGYPGTMTDTAPAPSAPARPASEIPVAPSVPLLGSLPWMATDAAGFLERVAIEKGPIVRIPFGKTGMVMLTHPDDVRYVLHDAAKKYVRGNQEVVEDIFGNGLALSDPPFWLRQRRIMQPSFSRARIAKMVGAMNEVAERHLARLRDGQEIVTRDFMMGITRDVITATMFSQQAGSDMDDLDHALSEIDRFTKIRMLMPFHVPLSWPLPANVRVRKAVAAFDRVVYGFIDRRERGGERPGDLLDALLDGRDEETGERMSRKELRDEVLHIFFAGHETTANALTSATLLLTLHPEEQQRVRAEVDAVLEGRAPQAEDVPKLVRTGMVLRETMRLYPPAWMIPRKASEDDVIRGYVIPRDTLVMISPFALHRLPSLWPDPRRFRPDRFADDPATIGGGKSWTYLPFGGGPHVCIGNHFGLTEMAIVLARLTQRGKLVATKPSETRPRGTTALGVTGGVPARFEASAGGRGLGPLAAPS